ncbi:MAG: hypothetical protein ABL914_02975 [Novosphingobium sp.]|uniref:hypothetical protein n=1 Tax=Novosphingobium sp. TaxID=1874826 RepID=UPI0032BA24D7
MAEQSWWAVFAAAFGGAGSFAAIELIYKEIKEWRVGKRDHQRNVDQSLEPLLRASDELVGKLRSLAEQDFLPIRKKSDRSLADSEIASLVYLFVQFWAEVEVVRFRGLSVEIARTDRGRQTQAFLNCLQSRKVRLIDRASQRALGEVALIEGRTMNFVEFIRSVEPDPLSARWLQPLTAVLGELHESEVRQRVLQYFCVLHALIDTLDPNHLITRDRPGTPNKLNKESRKALNYRVFNVYLGFVSGRSKYIGPLN